MRIGDGPGPKLNPAWRRETEVKPGDRLNLRIWPEGPQRASLDPDLAAALAAKPKAAIVYDGLAAVYRKAYLNWIGATKRKPEERALGVAQTVNCSNRKVAQGGR